MSRIQSAFAVRMVAQMLMIVVVYAGFFGLLIWLRMPLDVVAVLVVISFLFQWDLTHWLLLTGLAPSINALTLGRQVVVGAGLV